MKSTHGECSANAESVLAHQIRIALKAGWGQRSSASSLRQNKKAFFLFSVTPSHLEGKCRPQQGHETVYLPQCPASRLVPVMLDQLCCPRHSTEGHVHCDSPVLGIWSPGWSHWELVEVIGSLGLCAWKRRSHQKWLLAKCELSPTLLSASWWLYGRPSLCTLSASPA